MNQNNSPYIIAITGSIGTGKSAAVNILRHLGFLVVDSDKIVHDGYNGFGKMYQDVLKFFKEDIINKDNTINRQKLGQIVFSNQESLKMLNVIVHKFVVHELMNAVEKCKDNVIFLDIPLMIEEKENLLKYGLRYDEIWLVYVNQNIQKQRLIKRAIEENKKPDDVIKIINNQISIEEKKNMVDEVIINEGSLKDLYTQINKVLNKKGIGYEREKIWQGGEEEIVEEETIDL